MRVVRFLAGMAAVIGLCALVALAFEPGPTADGPRIVAPHRLDGPRPGSSLEGLGPALAWSRAVAVGEWIAAVEEAERVEAARVAAAAKVVEEERAQERRRLAPAVPSSTGPVDWDAVARCETGGDWAMHGSIYSGGLGFANTSWDGYGGREFASHAGLASREQQIVVAERIRTANGGGLAGAWGCSEYGGVG